MVPLNPSGNARLTESNIARQLMTVGPWDDMIQRTLPRKAPELLTGKRLVTHFELNRRILVDRAQMAGGLSPVSTGNARELFVQEFLVDHLPGDFVTGSGHVLFESEPSPQLDLIIARRDSLALPLGSIGLFFPDGVVARIEVKSALDADGLQQAGKSFEMLSSEVLKVIYSTDKWLPLALLVFELAQRGSGASWSRYLMPHLPAPSTLSRLLAREE